MAFLIRKPFILIIIGIISLVLIIQFSGVLNPKTVVILPSLAPSSISWNMKENNATLTVVIENKGTRQYSVGYHIVGTFTSNQLKFYDKINGTLLPNPVLGGKNYTITYPITMKINTGEQRTISIIVKGLDPKIDSATYTIYVEAWADGALADRKSVQLTVTQT